MNIQKFTLSTVLASSVFAATAVYAAPGEPYSDEWIEGRISGALDYNSAVNSSNVTVDANGGSVTLKGKVPSEIEKDFVGQVARSVDGVVGIQNELTVDENLKYEPRSSFKQKFSDAMITAAIKSKLLANRNTHALAVNVDTAANAVTLSGKVSTAAEKSLAEKLAFETNGVRQVTNQLTVEGKPIATAKESASNTAAVSDAWISTKARAILTFSNDFPGSDVDVTTTNGQVKIAGFAHSPEQKQQIASRVADVAGVKSVDNQLVVRHQM